MLHGVRSIFVDKLFFNRNIFTIKVFLQLRFFFFNISVIKIVHFCNCFIKSFREIYFSVVVKRIGYCNSTICVEKKG